METMKEKPEVTNCGTKTENRRPENKETKKKRPEETNKDTRTERKRTEVAGKGPELRGKKTETVPERPMRKNSTGE